ncbi:Ketosamine-3-kinase [Vanrija pseudolonga]|uniref:protein-ribulosamine 3-kinase n=1 Tax=Vanrija pseudolonga TaxID=143232 RepID=A0AAF0Y3V5_9TREE|nr:Ketosamine-3-kinase [Vanrija pseudolonga]
MPLHPLIAAIFTEAGHDPSLLPQTATDILRTPSGVFYTKVVRGTAAAQARGEAASLVAMARDAPPGLVPTVLGVKEDNGSLAMVSSYVDGSRAPDFQARLGAALAAMHAPGRSSRYGFDTPTHCGATEQRNDWNESWEAFFRDQRLGDLVRRLGDARISNLWEEMVAGAVPLLLGHFSPPPTPVILHGDLWSGNVAASRDGMPVIYDPASYYGHGEADLGITHMFGGFTPAFYDAYHAVHPRSAPYYDQRQQLYELYHHLNHALMFGGGYVGSAVRIMRGLVAWAEGVEKGASGD